MIDTLIQIGQHALAFLNSVPAGVWSTIIQIVVSAIVVSPVALGLKKWWNINSPEIINYIVIALSLLAPALVYLTGRPEFAPYLLLVQGALTYLVSQPVYFRAVRPLFNRLAIWWTSTVASAAALNEVKTAEKPASGLPISK